MSENLFGLTVAADKGLDDLQCQRLLSENRRYQEVMLQYRCALKALESRLEILNEEFSLQHDRNPIESMKSRLKSPSSIMNKMQKCGLSLDFPTMQSIITSGLSFFAATIGIAIYSNIDMISAICTLLARGAVIGTVAVIFILPAMFMIFDKLICKTTLKMGHLE